MFGLSLIGTLIELGRIADVGWARQSLQTASGVAFVVLLLVALRRGGHALFSFRAVAKPKGASARSA
jgi:hypothetical protein